MRQRLFRGRATEDQVDDRVGRRCRIPLVGGAEVDVAPAARTSAPPLSGRRRSERFPRLPRIGIVRDLRTIARMPGARYALVVACLALFGLLSMHGWGTHAGMHAETSHAPSHVALVHSDAHAATPDTPRHGRATPTSDYAASCDNTCGDGGSDGGMGLAGLCLAVLGGVLAAAFALLLLWRCFPLLRTMLATFRHPVLLGRDRDPPDLLRLCVIRC